MTNYNPVDEAVTRMLELMNLGDGRPLVARRLQLAALYDGLCAARDLYDDELGCSREALGLMTSTVLAFVTAAELAESRDHDEALRMLDVGHDLLIAVLAAERAVSLP